MAIRFPRFTAARRQAALVQAEKDFARSDMKRGRRKHVSIRTSQIKERLELFQPREFSYRATSVDARWAKELARRIGIYGELDPVLVIRLGKEWVCVDGHHRIAAYRTRNHRKPIRCEWFDGTPTEAVTECMRRNNRDHLPIPREDRMEEAWRRVLLTNDSKGQISKTCGVSPGTVAIMRRTVRDYEKDPAFAARVGRPLFETSWGIMLLARRDVEEREFDLKEQSDKLARTIGHRLSNLLKKDPVVTAHALAKYDPHLPRRLLDIWSGQMTAAGSRTLTEPEKRRQVQVLRNRADVLEAELAKREQNRPQRLAAAEEKAAKKQSEARRMRPPPEFDPTEDAEPYEF